MLNWEKRESEKRLNNIDDLIRVNLNALPNRTYSGPLEHLCNSSKPSPCLPPLKFFEGEIRASTVILFYSNPCSSDCSSIQFVHLCSSEEYEYCNDFNVLLFTRREKVCSESKRHPQRLENCSVFGLENSSSIFKLLKIDPKKSNWTHIMMVRHPVERFVSGFVDKCYRKPVIEKFCNGCGRNLTCFMETEFQRMSRQVEEHKFLRTYEDRHFFPQNWRCNLHEYYQNFTFVPYSSSPNFSVTSQLFPIFRAHGVPESSLEYIQTALSAGRTAHSTVSSKATQFIEKRLTSSPYLMELLVKMFYHDFVLFNFTLPVI